MVKFKAKKDDQYLIMLIMERVQTIDGWVYGGLDLMDLEMTIYATHLNGCPLDLQKLLDSEPFDFAHDILGMIRHINKDNGSLNNFFVPRCALPEVDDESHN